MRKTRVLLVTLFFFLSCVSCNERSIYLQSNKDFFKLSPKLRLVENAREGVFMIAEEKILPKEPAIQLEFDHVFFLDTNFPFRKEIFLYLMDKVEPKKGIQNLNRVLSALSFHFYTSITKDTAQMVAKLNKEEEFFAIQPKLKEYLNKLEPTGNYYQFNNDDFKLLKLLNIKITPEKLNEMKDIKSKLEDFISEDAKKLLKIKTFTNTRCFAILSIIDSRSFIVPPSKTNEIPAEALKRVLFSDKVKKDNTPNVAYQILMPYVDLINYCSFEKGKPETFASDVSVVDGKLNFSLNYQVNKHERYCYTYGQGNNLVLLEYFGFIPTVNFFDNVTIKLDKSIYNENYIDYTEAYLFKNLPASDFFELNFRMYTHFNSHKVVHAVLNGENYDTATPLLKLRSVLYLVNLLRKEEGKTNMKFVLNAIFETRQKANKSDLIYKRRSVFFEYLIMRNRILMQAELEYMKIADELINEMGL